MRRQSALLLGGEQPGPAARGRGRLCAAGDARGLFGEGGTHGGSSAQTPLRAPWDSSHGSTPALARGWEFFWHQASGGNASVPGEGSGVNNASCRCVLRSGLGAGGASTPRGRGRALRAGWLIFPPASLSSNVALRCPCPHLALYRWGRGKSPRCAKKAAERSKSPPGPWCSVLHHGAMPASPRWASELLLGRNPVSADPVSCKVQVLSSLHLQRGFQPLRGAGASCGMGLAPLAAGCGMPSQDPTVSSTRGCAERHGEGAGPASSLRAVPGRS